MELDAAGATRRWCVALQRKTTRSVAQLRLVDTQQLGRVTAEPTDCLLAWGLAGLYL